MVLTGAAKAQGGRDEMQDVYTVVQQEDVDLTFVGIFDGHGRQGDVVAQFCADRLPIEVISRLKSGTPQKAIAEAISRMDKELIAAHSRMERAPNQLRLVEMGGTTAVVALLQGDQLVTAIVGDGRIILSKNGTAMDLCGEHKPTHPREAARIRAAGGTVAMGRLFGEVSTLDMSRSIGDFVFKNNRMVEWSKQMVISIPEISGTRTIVEADEFFVVTSDGIQHWSSQQVVDFIRERIRNGQALDSICEELLRVCDAPDNMCIVLVQLKKDI